MTRDIVLAWDDFLAMADVPPDITAANWQQLFPRATHFNEFRINIMICRIGSHGFVNMYMGSVWLPWPIWTVGKLKNHLECAYDECQFFIVCV